MTSNSDQTPDENGKSEEYPERRVRIHSNFHISDFLTILSAFVTSVATIFIAVYTVKLSQSTELIQRISVEQAATMTQQSVSINKSIKQTERIIEISRAQTAAVVEQAQMAEIANSQSEINAKKQLRAYIVYESFDSNNYHPILRFRNVGQTPAIDVTFHIRCMITDADTLEKGY